MKEFETIDRDRLRGWINDNKDVVIVDVLSKESYENRHLPKAVNVEVGDKDFAKKVGKHAKKDSRVVVYCSSFDCTASPKAAEKLAKAGYSEVYDFEGGIADWEDAGYPFEKHGQLVY